LIDAPTGLGQTDSVAIDADTTRRPTTGRRWKERNMRVGLVLMNAGETNSYDTLGQIARHAEAIGYDSLWVTEREPFPIVAESQRSIPSGILPTSRQPIALPIEALAVAAVQTETIQLGISLPNIPFYSPLTVGQSLAALDILSNGRVQVGLGIGSTPDEVGLVTDALSRPGTPAAEFLRVLKTVWSGGEIEYHGDHYVIPRCSCGVTPIQRPHPAVRLTAFAPAAVQRPAQLLRGGAPLFPSVSADAMAGALRSVALPVALSAMTTDIVARAVVQLAGSPLGEGRAMFAGSSVEVRGDIAFVQAMGVSEILFDLGQAAAGRDAGSIIEAIGGLIDLVPERVEATPFVVAA
jgi:alkanesulfonate monooxygenase SsuD/methylene tetrahydromethanopterin reductase-like flavin-dependent oxidoreductase (luciferase family)